MGSIVQVLLRTPKEQQQQTLLDLLMSKDRRCNRTGQQLESTRLTGNVFDGLDISRLQLRLLDVLAELPNAVGNEDCVEDARSIWLGTNQSPVHTGDLDPVPGLDFVHQIILRNNINIPWQSTRRCVLWHFLNGKLLRVLVLTQAPLKVQLIPVLIQALNEARNSSLRCQRCGVTMHLVCHNPSSWTEMDACEQLWASIRVLRHNAPHQTQAIDHGGVQATRRHMLPPELPHKRHAEGLLPAEQVLVQLLILLGDHQLQRLFKWGDVLGRKSHHQGGKPRLVSIQIMNLHIKACRSASFTFAVRLLAKARYGAEVVKPLGGVQQETLKTFLLLGREFCCHGAPCVRGNCVLLQTTR
mmetsp:Transcript_11200/g.26700  ORF Transcript_11200/g.26700 Transcript_11200/m.26700 type:complete len:356 (-) Transcript_11200:4-1071(-)